jgi:hypothetical protein
MNLALMKQGNRHRNRDEQPFVKLEDQEDQYEDIETLAAYQSRQKVDEAANLKAAREEGEIRGEEKKALAVAVELIKQRAPDELILRVTKLSEKTLKQIKESIQYR